MPIAQQFLHRVLRRLCLQLLRGRNPWHQREVDKHRILAPQFLPHLANCLEEGKRFDIADRSADLHDGYVVAVGRNLPHRILNFIRDVRNHLDRLAQVVAAPFLQNDLLVDPSRGEIVVARKRSMREALVMPQIQVGFRAVVGHKDLAVLERRHGSWIDVEIRVELHHVHAKATALKQATDRCGRKALA